jgi:hypothetical protein
MRALCGAIITAGALIGLGLTAIGLGTRYAEFARYDVNPNNYLVKWQDLDRGLLYLIVFLSASAVIGLGIAFLGLAYHHQRRHHEFLRDHAHHEHPQQQPPTRVLS